MLYVAKLFICFIFFSFAGWCLEVAFGLAVLKRFVNRGFLIGPQCPLYGLGCVLLYTLLCGFSGNPLVLAVMSMIICSVLEYMASYILEKIFKTRWWDYNNMKFNINGRICLELAIPFGLLGLGVVYFFFPFALWVLDMLSPIVIYSMAGIFATIFIVDAIVSFKVVVKFTDLIGKAPKDMTEEIKKFMKEKLFGKNKKAKN